MAQSASKIITFEISTIAYLKGRVHSFIFKINYLFRIRNICQNWMLMFASSFSWNNKTFSPLKGSMDGIETGHGINALMNVNCKYIHMHIYAYYVCIQIHILCMNSNNINIWTTYFQIFMILMNLNKWNENNWFLCLNILFSFYFFFDSARNAIEQKGIKFI